MSVVDVSRIPNNNKFDPVREAILQLEGIIQSGTAGVFSVNGEQGTLTIQAGANTSVSTSNGVITISSTASTGTLDNTLTLTAGDGISLSSPSVFDGSADVNITITNDDRPNAGILTIVAGSGLTTATAVNWEDEPQTWSQQGRIWSVSEGNTFSANELNDKSVTLQHAESSSATSTTNAFGVVLQNISIDNFGHVQSFGNLDLDTRYVQLTDSRIPNWTAAYNDKINSATFSTATGIITLNQQDGGTVTVDIDGRFLLSTDARIANWDAAYSWGDHALEGYLTSFSETDPTVPSHVKAITTTNITNWNAAYNDKINGASFNTSTGVLTLTQQDLGTVTVDLDGKYLDITAKAADSNLLDGLDSTYFLNYNNLTNAPTVNDNTITVAAGGGIAGGGAFTVNQSFNETITVSHADTSSQASVNNSGTTFIQDVTLDTYGHVTGLASASVTIPTVYDSIITIAAGGAMTGGGSFGINQSFGETITINHADTSAQGSVNNAGGTVIQDISLDAYGHVTSIGSANLDGRYLAIGAKAADSDLLDGLDGSYYLDYNNLINKPTTTVANNNTITIAGTGGLSGVFGSFTVNQSFDETIFISLPNTGVTATTYGSSTQVPVITVDTKGRITSATTVAVSGGGGGVGTLQQVTDLGNTTDNNVGIGANTTPLYTLDVTGTIRATNDVIAFSDERVKENVETISDAVEKVLCLRGVTFNKINEAKRSMGVIAQEIENILPEVVHTDEDGMKAVAYGNIVGVLIEAIKEQQHQIEKLKAEVQYLKSK